jgi:hypothetical protein
MAVSVGPGGNRVDQDVRRELARPGAGHREDRALRSAIDGAVHAAEVGEFGGKVDDSPAALQGHQVDGLAPDQKSAAQVDSNQPVKVLGGGLEQRLLDQNAGIVDQDVETAEASLDSLEQGEHLCLVGNVSPDGEGFPAPTRDRGDDRFGDFSGGEVRDRDDSAFPRDVASLYLFLASDHAASVTGQAYNVDRGEVMA